MTIKRQLCIVLILPVTTACGLVGQAANGQPSAPFTSSQKQGAVASPSPRKHAVVTVAEAKQILARWDSAEKEAMRQGGTDRPATEAGLIAARLLTTEGDDPRAKRIIIQNIYTAWYWMSSIPAPATDIADLTTQIGVPGGRPGAGRARGRRSSSAAPSRNSNPTPAAVPPTAT
jgi:hypothetical protein